MIPESHLALKKKLLQLSNDISREHFQILDPGIGLGKVVVAATKSSVIAPNHQPVASQASLNTSTTSRSAGAGLPGGIKQARRPEPIGGVATTTPHSPKKKGQLGLTLTRIAVGHLIDLIVVLASLLMIAVALQWNFGPASTEPFWKQSIDVFSALSNDWQGLVSTLDLVLVVYSVFVIYAIVLKVVTGTTLGHYVCGDKRKKLQENVSS